MGQLILNPDTMEDGASKSRPKYGYTVTRPAILSELFLLKSGSLTSVAAVGNNGVDTCSFGLVSNASNQQGLYWDGTEGGGGGSLLLFPFKIGRQFAKGQQSGLKLAIPARKIGTGTNDDLKLYASIRYTMLGVAAEQTISAVISDNLLDTDSYSDANDGFRDYEFDIGQHFRDHGVIDDLKFGTNVIVRVYPHQAVGTDLRVELLDGEWIYNEHISLAAGFKRLRTSR